MTSTLSEFVVDVPSTPVEEYSSLVRSLRRRKGFGLEFVRCSPAGGKELITKVRKDLPQKAIAVLELKEPISNLIDKINDFPNQQNLNILFIAGLEKSLVEYIRSGYGGAGDYYNLDTIPPILSHLNWQRENFRNYFGHLCFVFLLPSFAIKYILRRAPDFFDWGAGIIDFPTDSANVEMASMHITWERSEIEDYLALNGNERIEKLLEIQELIDEPNQADDRRAELYLEQGLIHGLNNEFEEAIASFDKALEIKPEDHEVWNGRSYALGELGRYEEAIASYDQALEIKPDDHELWNGRGVALGNLGRYEEENSSYDQALEIKPDDHKAWCNRGVTLGNLGRYEEAIASYDRALELKPDDPSPYYNKACAYSLQNQIELALENLQKAIQLSPEEYRKMAKTDIDFDSIRYDPGFQALIFPKET
jgi:Flp pilus assembly protein TadD